MGSYMPVHVYRQPGSSDKSASEFVICMHAYLCMCIRACGCACVCVCVCVCVWGASCCAGSDKGGSRGLELIKCNDAMWGDLTVCVLIK